MCLVYSPYRPRLRVVHPYRLAKRRKLIRKEMAGDSVNIFNSFIPSFVSSSPMISSPRFPPSAMVKRKSEAADTANTPNAADAASVLKSASSKKHKTFDDAGSTNNGAEIDFPRGGGTGLTNLETAQAKQEGRRDADRDVSSKKKPAKVRPFPFKSCNSNALDRSQQRRSQREILRMIMLSLIRLESSISTTSGLCLVSKY